MATVTVFLLEGLVGLRISGRVLEPWYRVKNSHQQTLLTWSNEGLDARREMNEMVRQKEIPREEDVRAARGCCHRDVGELTYPSNERKILNVLLS